MNLDDLVKAAIAKALADYISTLSNFDEGFMGKLADMVSQRVWQRQETYRQQVQKDYTDKLREAEQRMQRELADRMAKSPRPWVDQVQIPESIKKRYGIP